MAAKDEVRRSKLEDNNLLFFLPYPWFSAVEERFSPSCVEISSKLWKNNPAWICLCLMMVGMLGMMIGRAVEWVEILWVIWMGMAEISIWVCRLAIILRIQWDPTEEHTFLLASTLGLSNALSEGVIEEPIKSSRHIRVFTSISLGIYMLGSPKLDFNRALLLVFSTSEFVDCHV